MKKELNTPVFYFLAMCRGHPWTSHIDVDPENFQRLQLISKASLKGWALIFLAFDFLSSKMKILLCIYLCSPLETLG